MVWCTFLINSPPFCETNAEGERRKAPQRACPYLLMFSSKAKTCREREYDRTQILENEKVMEKKICSRVQRLALGNYST
jgi:hypothetical protein